MKTRMHFLHGKLRDYFSGWLPEAEEAAFVLLPIYVPLQHFASLNVISRAAA